jgi:hypothetical protein
VRIFCRLLMLACLRQGVAWCWVTGGVVSLLLAPPVSGGMMGPPDGYPGAQVQDADKHAARSDSFDGQISDLSAVFDKTILKTRSF